MNSNDNGPFFYAYQSYASVVIMYRESLTHYINSECWGFYIRHPIVRSRKRGWEAPRYRLACLKLHGLKLER